MHLHWYPVLDFKEPAWTVFTDFEIEDGGTILSKMSATATILLCYLTSNSVEIQIVGYKKIIQLVILGQNCD